MTVEEVLEAMKHLAERDPALREKLIATQHSKEAVADFCRICTECGFPLYEMDLISAGEEYYAAMRRSTNGGGKTHHCFAGLMTTMRCSSKISKRCNGTFIMIFRTLR